MRRVQWAVFIAVVVLPTFAQTPPRGRVVRPLRADAAEAAIKQAAEQLAKEKTVFERNVEVLRHLRAADDALADSMQPAVAIQKSHEEVQAAKRLPPEFVVMQGVVRAERELEAARRSPGTADLARLRTIIRDEALGPASRVAVQSALRLQEEAVAWLKIQQLIADHLRVMSEISSDSLRNAVLE